MSQVASFVAAEIPRGMNLRADISQRFLSDHLSYDAETGIFRWLGTNPQREAGKAAGHQDVTGYIYIRLNRRLYGAHRLAWLAIYGSFPARFVDHVNGVRNDNRIVNLRECRPQDNLRNKRCDLGAKSGFKGVRFHTLIEKYEARICVDRKMMSLGCFETSLEASRVYDDAARFYFGEFARPNHAA